MGCAQKWYADKKGLATGVIGGAVRRGAHGAGGVVHRAVGHPGLLWALGVLLGLVCGGASLLLQNPEKRPRPQSSRA